MSSFSAVCLGILCLVAELFPSAHSAVYYVAGDGSDANSGNSSSPWRTVARLNSHNGRYQAGDSILLRRGDVWREQLLPSDSFPNNVTIASYGDPALPPPTISGSLLVPANANWVSRGSSVFSLNLTTAFPGFTFTRRINALYANGTRMTVARWPNRVASAGRVNFAYVSRISGRRSLLSSDLTKPTGYWVGATLHVRTNSWKYREMPVVAYSHSGSGGNLTTNTDWTSSASWDSDFGFFLDNVRTELDYPGEWFHDVPARMIYFRAPRSDAPRKYRIELGWHTHGIRIGCNAEDLTIRDLQFEHQLLCIAAPNNNTRLVIENCSFRNAEQYGVDIDGICNDCGVWNNSFRDILGNALFIHYGGNNDVGHNVFRDIGLWEGLISDVSPFAMNIKTTNTRVHHNLVERVGSAGILAQQQNITIDSNIIGPTMLTVGDSGCIYTTPGTTGVQGMAITNNVLFDAVGSIDSMGENNTAVYGIYLDASVVGPILILNNTVFNCTGGALKFSSTQNATVVGNSFHNGQLEQGFGPSPTGKEWSTQRYLVRLFINYVGGPTDPYRDMGVLFACNSITSVGYPLIALPYRSWATFTKNRYCSPHPFPFRASLKIAEPTFAEWLANTSDTGSVWCTDSLPECNWADYIPDSFARFRTGPRSLPPTTRSITTRGTTAVRTTAAKTTGLRGTTAALQTTAAKTTGLRPSTAAAVSTAAPLTTVASVTTGLRASTGLRPSTAAPLTTAPLLTTQYAPPASTAARSPGTSAFVPTTERVTTGTTSTGTTSTGTAPVSVLPTKSAKSLTKYFYQSSLTNGWATAYTATSAGLPVRLTPAVSSADADTTLRSRDGNYAHVALPPRATAARLVFQRSGDALPDDAIVTGFSAYFVRYARSPAVQDVLMSLVFDGRLLAGSDRLASGPGPAWAELDSAESARFGGPTDMWGLSSDALTIGEINSNKFGLALETRNFGDTSAELFLNEVTLQIHYALPVLPADAEVLLQSDAESEAQRSEPAAGEGPSLLMEWASSDAVTGAMAASIAVGASVLLLAAAAFFVVRRRAKVHAAVCLPTVFLPDAAATCTTEASAGLEEPAELSRSIAAV